MSWIYRTLLRPVLFAQEPEDSHDRTLKWLGFLGRHEVFCDALESFVSLPPLPVELFGLRFPNPVGLAAGMDKYAAALPVWPALGFGFCEIGGVTWHAQSGNPLPRLFRAEDDEALINRMGFNNPGAEAMAETLVEWRALGRWPGHPVAINLGKSKITPLGNAAEDYANSFRVLCPLADFFVVNVSSPNTPNLRQLQDKTALDEILAAIQEINANRGLEPHATQSAIRNPHSPRPILVKVAPDLSFEALDEILELAAARRLAGIVASNTTVSRPETADPSSRRIYAQAGGLSGKPLRARATEIVRHIYRQTKGQFPIVGVGGIFTAEDAWEKICAGASLVQLYTGLVYEGPGVVKEIVTGLHERLRGTGLGRIQQAAGLEA